MPRRRRHRKRRRRLTLARDLLLHLGPPPGEPPPEPGSEEWEALRACFDQYRHHDGEDRYGAGTWGHAAFVEGRVWANPLIVVGEDEP
jgi:hypothetical protein